MYLIGLNYTDALIGNNFIRNLQRTDFNGELFAAYKALQGRYRRRLARHNGGPLRGRRRAERRPQGEIRELHMSDSGGDNSSEADLIDENQENE